uniref:Uncharacterized protein n=1 Tax=Oryza rufipogon TaxID=4529 RepID=A0A0E0RBD9_ORYRU
MVSSQRSSLLLPSPPQAEAWSIKATMKLRASPPDAGQCLRQQGGDVHPGQEKQPAGSTCAHRSPCGWLQSIWWSQPVTKTMDGLMGIAELISIPRHYILP